MGRRPADTRRRPVHQSVEADIRRDDGQLYNRHREPIAQKQLALAQNETGKAKLGLAEKYRAYLAASLVLWCGMRRGNVRQLRVNLDIWRGRDADGNDAIFCDPLDTKTAYRMPTEMQRTA